MHASLSIQRLIIPHLGISFLLTSLKSHLAHFNLLYKSIYSKCLLM